MGEFHQNLTVDAQEVIEDASEHIDALSTLITIIRDSAHDPVSVRNLSNLALCANKTKLQEINTSLK